MPLDLRWRRGRSRPSYGIGLKPDGERRVAPQRGQEAIGMRALEVALHALRAQHPAIERELLPGLEADDLVVS